MKTKHKYPRYYQVRINLVNDTETIPDCIIAKFDTGNFFIDYKQATEYYRSSLCLDGRNMTLNNRVMSVECIFLELKTHQEKILVASSKDESEYFNEELEAIVNEPIDSDSPF